MLLSTIESRAVQFLRPNELRTPVSSVTHLLWFCDGLLLFYLVSWFGTSVLTLDNDFYYAVFIWTALTFLWMYMRATNTPVLAIVRNRWRSSVFIGVLAAIYLVANVWQASPTEHPDGLLLLFEVAWRGVAYGIADSLVLTAFPVAVALGIFDGKMSGVPRRIGLSVLTLILVWVMSLTYHLGFNQFSADDLAVPQIATTAVSVPAIVTSNPVGSVLAQVSFHVSVTIRTFESGVLVPPEVEFFPDFEPPGVFGPR